MSIQMEHTSMEPDWFAKRLSQLRMQRGISARDMSLSLGQSESYINKIENGKALPSMRGFFYICDFLNVTPKEFFDDSMTSPQAAHRLTAALSALSPEQMNALTEFIERMT